MIAILYVSIAIIVLALIWLVIGVVQAVKAASSQMKTINETMERIQKKTDGLINESETLTQRLEVINDSVNRDMEAIQELTNTLKGSKEAVGKYHIATRAVATETLHENQKRTKENEQMAQIRDIGDTVVDLYAKWKNRKQA